MPSRSRRPLLRICNLSIVRDGAQILDDVSWTVQSGEHWVLLGPNGSGKSSLLSALAGYFPATAGTCEVLGASFGDSDWRDLREHLGIVSGTVAAMVPADEPAAYTVVTGLNSGIGLWGDPTPAVFAKAKRCLERVELGGLEERRWEALSQGEKQRVLIARALIREPSILILDEPCAGLDPVAREGFLGFLERLLAKTSGPAVVLVTHHVEEMVPGFTHGLLLKKGRVWAAGPLEETMRSPVLEGAFEARLHVRKRGGRYQLRLPPRAEGSRSMVG